ncbi:adenylate/guanylate cyclase domain-containing protein [Nocardioides sp. KC13]|uniref:Adenylate/guanylate cyclase domain-containing protein n=1 Tax=Nocardioides turkmenicus TaxID=2711220 RepID=A0A6M1QZF8_9ACTN|nr:adenylate/guanylate cyclase domain-containing protein [Nocardioides sp. KC13]NGN91841.1 adenylate/guanylate cyclase domain-containing protein [Nocardioides sp. KC13]
MTALEGLAPRLLSPAWLLWRIRIVLTILLGGANLIGAGVAYCLVVLVVPSPQVAERDQLELLNLVLTAAYTLPAVALATLRGYAITRGIATWQREQREPESGEQEKLLRTPARLVWVQVQLWILAAVVFGLLNAQRSAGLGGLVMLVVGLTGLAVCTVTYLMAERVLRPLARRALTSGVPDRLGIRTVGFRAMLVWIFGTGIAVLGIVLSGLLALLLGDEVSRRQLVITMVVLGGTALLVGSFSTFLASRAVADPVRAMRDGVARVRRGDLTARVEIYDGTELGILQAGFNDMMAGLREREQIRELFGQQVGVDVARTALEGGVNLGGEVRDVAVLFVDIIGSTALATRRPPDEVVTLLNRFFGVVIDVVHEHGGWINKFAGDAALAIWGAPVEVEDRARRALAAARILAHRLAFEVPELTAAIGISAGPVVAGNVGTHERHEYTVIGDPVNEAARLTDHAKGVRGRVIARANLLPAADGESSHWQVLEPVTVRGRSEPTPIARLQRQ